MTKKSWEFCSCCDFVKWRGKGSLCDACRQHLDTAIATASKRLIELDTEKVEEDGFQEARKYEPLEDNLPRAMSHLSGP